MTPAEKREFRKSLAGASFETILRAFIKLAKKEADQALVKMAADFRAEMEAV